MKRTSAKDSQHMSGRYPCFTPKFSVLAQIALFVNRIWDSTVPKGTVPYATYKIFIPQAQGIICDKPFLGNTLSHGTLTEHFVLASFVLYTSWKSVVVEYKATCDPCSLRTNLPNQKVWKSKRKV